VLVVPEERSAYIKIDSKVTNRFEVEQASKLKKARLNRAFCINRGSF
jgi:hypothetical protein